MKKVRKDLTWLWWPRRGRRLQLLPLPQEPSNLILLALQLLLVFALLALQLLLEKERLSLGRLKAGSLFLVVRRRLGHVQAFRPLLAVLSHSFNEEGLVISILALEGIPVCEERKKKTTNNLSDSRRNRCMHKNTLTSAGPPRHSLGAW